MGTSEVSVIAAGIAESNQDIPNRGGRFMDLITVRKITSATGLTVVDMTIYCT